MCSLSLVAPLRLRYCPVRATARQEAFLRIPDKEVFYGGAAAGGKTTALLMAALQYADVPGYNALLVRTSLAELSLSCGTMDLAHSWLSNTKAYWSGDTEDVVVPQRRPGHVRLPRRRHRPRTLPGTGYAMIGLRAPRFPEPLYRGMFRSLRQPSGGATFGAAADGTRLDQVPARDTVD